VETGEELDTISTGSTSTSHHVLLLPNAQAISAAGAAKTSDLTDFEIRQWQQYLFIAFAVI